MTTSGESLSAAVERILEPLIGLPLAWHGHAVDMATFGFGASTEWVDQRSRRRMRHEYGLHIQCPWRISTNGVLIVGYRDMAAPPSGEPDEDFDPNEARRTRRDELIDELVTGPPMNPAVMRASASDAGDVAIEFDGGHRLETFRDHAALSWREDWRVLTPTGHWVFEGGRLEFAIDHHHFQTERHG